jgi:hypothetical protein
MKETISTGIYFTKGKKSFQLQKPSWHLRGEPLQGGAFYLAKRKAFETGGEFPKILKMPFEIIFLYHWLFAKGFEKDFSKRFAKTT